MGLLSKLKTTTGMVKAKAVGAIGALKARGASTSFGATASKVLQSRVGRGVVGAGKFLGKAAFGSKIRAAITVGTGALYIRKKLKERKQAKAESSAASGGGAALASSLKSPGLISRAAGFAKKHPVLTTAAGLGALYAGEQVAEKLGVRGGAGFFGKRRKKRSKTRKARSYKARSGGRRVSFTTKDGRRVSFMPKIRRSTVSYSPKRRGMRLGVSKTELRAVKALIRRSERD